MASSGNYSDWPKATSFSGYIKITATTPCDDRVVCESYSDAISKTKSRRYPGLKIYVMDEEKEYWFKSGVGNSNLIEYCPWSDNITTSINQLKTDKPWLADISGGGSGSGSSATTFVISGTEHTRDEIPAYLNEQITSPSTGQEVNVVFREDDVESFMKFIYINGDWAILDGTQAITFSIPAYGTEAWDTLQASSNDSIRYVTGENGAVTVYVKHNFCTQCVDSTLYQTGTGVEPGDTDETTDAYGEELLVSKKCVALSGLGGFWVKLEIQIPATPQLSESTTYTLLLQR